VPSKAQQAIFQSDNFPYVQSDRHGTRVRCADSFTLIVQVADEQQPGVDPPQSQQI
jgi:hypothetical protein